MILKGLRMRKRMRLEQDSARTANSGEGYENMKAWGLGRWGVGFLGYENGMVYLLE